MTTLHHSPITRRSLALGATAGAAAFIFGRPNRMVAHSIGSAASLASLGYPELKVAVTESAFEGVPAETAAGRYLLSVINKTTQEGNGGNVAFVSPTPIGLTTAETIDALMSLPPPHDPEQPPTGANHDDDLYCGCGQYPLFVYQLAFAGGADTQFGDAPHAVIDLLPGDYIIWGDGPQAAQQPATLKVTGDFPAEVAEPDADITGTMLDFSSSFEGTLTAGKHLMKIENRGAQPHQLSLNKGPDTMTAERFVAMFKSLKETGKPAPGGLSPDQLEPGYYACAQSIGTTTWHEVELTAGTYVAWCAFPTAGTGRSHFNKGQARIVKVTA